VTNAYLATTVEHLRESALALGTILNEEVSEGDTLTDRLDDLVRIGAEAETLVHHALVAAQPTAGLRPVLFHWSTEHGECYDCGLPAAFYRDGGREAHHQVCAVCAANDAANGSEIARIDGEHF
jgi:hypothetical protein